MLLPKRVFAVSAKAQIANPRQLGLYVYYFLSK